MRGSGFSVPSSHGASCLACLAKGRERDDGTLNPDPRWYDPVGLAARPKGVSFEAGRDAANARRASEARARYKLDPFATQRYMALYYAARVSGGICVGCSRPGIARNHTRCPACLKHERDTAKQRADARRAAGQCPKCGAADPPGRYCLRCQERESARPPRPKNPGQKNEHGPGCGPSVGGSGVKRRGSVRPVRRRSRSAV